MPTEGCGWDRITFARARVLRELADGRTEREIAEKLTMSYSGVRSQVEVLKALTGCHDVREIGRWWRVNRESWRLWCDEAGGVSAASTSSSLEAGFYSGFGNNIGWTDSMLPYSTYSDGSGEYDIMSPLTPGKYIWIEVESKDPNLSWSSSSATVDTVNGTFPGVLSLSPHLATILLKARLAIRKRQPLGWAVALANSLSSTG